MGKTPIRQSLHDLSSSFRLFHRTQGHTSHPLNLASGLDRHLSAQLWIEPVGVVAEGVARRIFWHENEELVVGHLQTKLLGNVAIVLRRLVASTAGAVELGARADARGGNVAEVLAGDGIAGPADIPAGDGRLRESGSEAEEGGAEDSEEGGGDHLGGLWSDCWFYWTIVIWKGECAVAADMSMRRKEAVLSL